MTLRVALIAPWLGRKHKGGAEQLAWQLATRLAASGVEVTGLTTRSVGFHADWSENGEPAGESHEDGVLVRRFAVGPRRRAEFDRVNAKLVAAQGHDLVAGTSPLDATEELVYIADNINSPALLEHLREHRRDHDVFVFLPYLFPTTIIGSLAVRERAVVVPCLHNESYAYLLATERMMRGAAALCFNSDGEQQLAQRIFGRALDEKSKILGLGVEIPTHIERYRGKSPVLGRYVLCLGRREPGKGTPLLMSAFASYCAANPQSDLRLVVAGPGTLAPEPSTSRIVDLGLVSDEDKLALLADCTALVCPSANESFSRVIFEAWLCRKPVVVHASCLATAAALRASGQAGWSAADEAGFAQACRSIDAASSATLAALGERGLAYAQKVASWDAVIKKYTTVLEDVAATACATERHGALRPARRGEGARSKRVVICSGNINSGDAVGHDVALQCEVLRAAGIQAHLYAAGRVDACYERLTLREEEARSACASSSTLVLLHHSSHDAKLTTVVDECRGPLVVRYHNVTPCEFFYDYSKVYYDATRRARSYTEELVRGGRIAHFIGDSVYNNAELAAYGAPPEKLSVVAPLHCCADFDTAAIDRALLTQLRSARVKLLFVGRFAPNKGHRHLIEAVRSYVNLYGRDVTLYMVGSTNADLASYLDELKHLIADYGLEDVVCIHHDATFSELHTYYCGCDALVVLSAHEGFCVPIIEAQRHGLPVVALDRGAVGETLGPQQLRVYDLDYDFIAGAAHKVATDAQVRGALARQGLINQARFDSAILAEKFLAVMSAYC